MRVPPGFNTVTPYFFVEGASAFIDFLVRGLGGTEVLRHVNGDRIVNAQVQLGSSTVMVSEASSAFPAMAAANYLYVENADDAMSRAIGAGATQQPSASTEVPTSPRPPPPGCPCRECRAQALCHAPQRSRPRRFEHSPS